MKTYEIKPMTEKGWSDIPKAFLEEKYFDTPDTTAWAQLAYDDDGLLLHLRTDEKEHRNVETGPIGIPCDDSCLEFFFSPSTEEKRYMNVEFNSNLCVYLGLATCIPDLVRILPDTDPMEILKPVAKRDEKGWEIEYKVPLTFIRRFFPDFEIYEGKKISANFYKCSEAMVPNHFLSWSKVDTEGFTFHQRHNFGEMIFVK